MSSVYLSNPYNSTTFTTCCQTAIGEERCCPSCGEEVEPQGKSARFGYAYRSGARSSSKPARDCHDDDYENRHKDIGYQHEKGDGVHE